MNDIEIPKKNLSDFNVAGLAQLVEHLICNQGARGSNPLAGTIWTKSFIFMNLGKILPPAGQVCGVVL